MSFQLFRKNVGSATIFIEYTESDSESNYIRVCLANVYLDHLVIVCQFWYHCFIRFNFQLRPSIVNKVYRIREALRRWLHAQDYRHYQKCKNQH